MTHHHQPQPNPQQQLLQLSVLHSTIHQQQLWPACTDMDEAGCVPDE